jgi:CoA:oxalate CoA-transferase
MLLADAGAEIIKIERPGAGDPRRHIAPFAENKNGERMGGGFMAYNRNKKSLVVNLNTDEGVAIFKRLAETCDGIVENLRPGVTTKLGIDYNNIKRLNENIIYTAISGFGQLPEYEGPYSDWPAFDIVAEAMSGMMHLVGFEDMPPQWTVYGLADIYTGVVAAYSTMLAFFQRERIRKGAYVDVAMYDSMMSLNERMVMLWSLTGQMQPRGRMRFQGPRGAFEAKDGHLALNIPNDLMWKRLCQAIDREDLVDHPKTIDGQSRAENGEFIRQNIEEWLGEKTREEARIVLMKQGVPCGPVYTAEDIFDCPQLRSRRMLTEIEDPEFGTYKFVQSPALLSTSPRSDATRSPRLGEHTREILSDTLGYNESEISNFAIEGVIECYTPDHRE